MKQRDTLKKVLSYLKHYKWLMALSVVIAAIVVALTLYVPILIGNAIDQIIEGGVQFQLVWRALYKVGIVTLVTAALQWIMNVINNKVTYHVVRDIRKEAFDKLQILPLSYIDAHPTGETVSRIITDVDQFADGLLMGFTQLFTGVVTILGTLVLMLTLNPKITIVVVVITPMSLLVANFIAKRTYSMFQLQSQTRAQQTALIDEMIGNAKVVKAYGHETAALERFDEINDALQKCSLRAIFYSSLTNPCTRFVNSIVYAAVALTGAFAVLSGHMTVGVLSCFLSYSNQYTKPFNEVTGVITELQNAIACAGRIFELMEEKTQPSDKENAVVLQEAEGNIACENVSFSYTPEQKLIENFSITVQPGQNVAIVGPTGCGKTTVINLLMRFYDARSGHIKVDGNDILDLTRHSLRKQYGMVLQETWLKSGTIRENIKMGKPDATDEEMIRAAKAAYSDSFIRRLPNGYDTQIGEDGGLLSQGQKQLLCITRIMLSLPPMLILDEATSSIDTRTEMKIQSAFNKLMEDRTCFIVAHRLSTIRNADIILVMKDGNIIEQGNHESLLKQNGFYATLYHS